MLSARGPFFDRFSCFCPPDPDSVIPLGPPFAISACVTNQQLTDRRSFDLSPLHWHLRLYKHVVKARARFSFGSSLHI